jgi:uncharacterized low-complexity protein
MIMKHFNNISKILLIVVTVAGLAIGMSSVAGLSDNTNMTIYSENSIMDSNCGSGKCGGGDTKETTTEAKCGEGKCGEGKCGGDNASTKNWNFMDIDTNGDGKVSKTEFADHGTKEFPNKDANNDGKLTNDECMMFDSFNTDGNEYLSKAEFVAGHNKMFSKMDENNDGFIDANESNSLHKSASAKCGGDEAKEVVFEKADDAKCGAGKCG